MGNLKLPSARKLLSPFLALLYAKPETAVHRLVYVKTKGKSISTGSGFCFCINKRIVNTKIMASVKKGLCNWVLNHPQAVQYPIANDFPKVSIYFQT